SATASPSRCLPRGFGAPSGGLENGGRGLTPRCPAVGRYNRRRPVRSARGSRVYQWWVFVHLIGVFGFLIAHGTSVGVLFRLRNERDPARVNALLQLSSASIQIFYGSLVVLLAGGFIAAFTGHLWATGGWLYAAIAVLVLTSVTMLQMARPYYRRVRLISQAMAGGSKAVTEEQLVDVLR